VNMKRYKPRKFAKATHGTTCVFNDGRRIEVLMSKNGFALRFSCDSESKSIAFSREAAEIIVMSMLKMLRMDGKTTLPDVHVFEFCRKKKP